MPDTQTLWDEDSYYYGVGADYILECGDDDMSLEYTFDVHRMIWKDGKGYVHWTPEKLNQLARHYLNTPKDRKLIDRCMDALWNCSMKEAITSIGKEETND